ncbi:hypothetical protein Ga0100231_020605 [Opitutaceae bacterium TAV4]|nr:hypothetical protein Ga0100231_020605 [Opitutaceae bacterium TAV4]
MIETGMNARGLVVLMLATLAVAGAGCASTPGKSGGGAGKGDRRGTTVTQMVTAPAQPVVGRVLSVTLAEGGGGGGGRYPHRAATGRAGFF